MFGIRGSRVALPGLLAARPFSRRALAEPQPSWTGERVRLDTKLLIVAASQTDAFVPIAH